MRDIRVQVAMRPEVKVAAEAQARKLGHPSLATMLRVIAAGLARDFQDSRPAPAHAADATTDAIQAALPKTTNLPPPEQFKNWPPWTGPHIAERDPELYRFYIETGVIS